MSGSAKQIRLTPAQADLLRELPCPCPESYAPAKNLVRLGLAHWVEGRFCSMLAATDEGRKAIAPSPSGEQP